MWVKLGNEYLNLDQVVRVRFNKAFRNGQEEWAAEVETLIKGELQIFTRYRGAEANALQAVLAPVAGKSAPGFGGQTIQGLAGPHAGSPMVNTLHDIKMP